MFELLIMTTLLLGFITCYLTFWQELKSMAEELPPSPALPYQRFHKGVEEGREQKIRDYEKVYEENTPFREEDVQKKAINLTVISSPYHKKMIY